MGNFNAAGEGDLDRIFITNAELVDQYVGEKLYSWGTNALGQLGDGTTNSSSLSPVSVAGGGSNWVQLSAGYISSAIKSDGTLWTWGSSGSYAIGDGINLGRSSPGTTAGGGTNWKQVSAGYSTTSAVAAIKSDGTLWTWGNGASGKLGTGDTSNQSSPVTTAGGGNNWKQVSSGDASVAAVKTDGTLWTWGTNTNGQLGDGTTSARSSPVTTAGGGSNWKQVSCGVSSVSAIKIDGTLWVWGQGSLGQLGTGNTTNRSSPVTVAGGGTNWRQTSAGYRFMAAIKTDGTLWTWGDNTAGQLGNGTTTSTTSPTTTIGPSISWKQVDCSEYLNIYGISDLSI